MSTPDLLEPPASEREAEMAKVAQRCLMTALDHSRAQRIALVDEKGAIADAPVLELPPQALRFFAEMLGMRVSGVPSGVENPSSISIERSGSMARKRHQPLDAAPSGPVMV